MVINGNYHDKALIVVGTYEGFTVRYCDNYTYLGYICTSDDSTVIAVKHMRKQ